MNLLTLIPHNTDIQFLAARRIAAIVSLMLVIGSLAAWGSIGLNTGIDFRGGFIIEAQAKTGNANVEALRSRLASLELGDFSLQEFGSPKDVLIRVQSQEEKSAPNEGQANKNAISKVQNEIGNEYQIRRTEFVGAVVGDELKTKAFYAVIAAIGAIMVYIWFRFEWPFAVSAIAALAHDIVSTIGLFAITGFEFNLATVAALLTIAGYSINDTVVIFDRIRDNLKKYKSWDNDRVITFSLNQTLTRTLMTSISTLVALFAIYLFGGAVLGGFALAMIWGIAIGTYSSVYVASAVLSLFDLRPGSDDKTALPEYERDEPHP